MFCTMPLLCVCLGQMVCMQISTKLRDILWDSRAGQKYIYRQIRVLTRRVLTPTKSNMNTSTCFL